jgi:hypothetical protein
MQFDVITLFPEMFRALTDWGITSRAASSSATPCGPGIRAISPSTTTGRSMIVPMAAAPAW